VNSFAKLAVTIRDRNLRLPAMPALPPMPRISVGNKSASKAIVFSIVLSTVVVGTGIFFAVKDVANATWDWPEAGAEYDLPQQMGSKLPNYEDGSESQTLQINLGATRLDRIELSGLDLGKVGLTDSFVIRRSATAGVTGSNAYLHIGRLIMTNSSAPSFSASNSQWGSVTLAARVDGHTQAMTIDATVPDIIIDSDRGAGSYFATQSVVDRIVIEIDSALGASIGELIITDVDASAGGFNFAYTKIGTVSIDASNSFGSGNGIDVASFTLADSISARSVTDSLVDTPINVR
jgi:hypothetical protein